jgi:glycosyltransferase involved in cell wall biosynthesis
MKILQLTPRTMLPPDDGGRISMWNVTKHLVACGAELTVVSLHEGEYTDSIVTHDSVSFRHILLPHSTSNSVPAITRSLFSSLPLYLAKHSSPQILAQLRVLCRQEKYDILHADHTAMAPLALALKREFGIPMGLRLHNVEWMIWKRYALSLGFMDPRRLYVNRQAEKLKREEARCIAQSDVSFTMSAVDEQRAGELVREYRAMYSGSGAVYSGFGGTSAATPIAGMPEGRIITAAAGVNTDEWSAPATNHRHPHELVLAAAWSWEHNVKGLDWFVSEVLPRVRKELPDVNLVLPGKHLPERFRTGSVSGVTAPGYVPMMQPYYHSAALFVCPLFVGSGVRIKIMEAMAAGLPVVATRVGAEGVTATEQDGLIISDDPSVQAQKILECLQDPERRERLSANARMFTQKHHEWRTEIAKIYAEYKRITNARL